MCVVIVIEYNILYVFVQSELKETQVSEFVLVLAVTFPVLSSSIQPQRQAHEASADSPVRKEIQVSIPLIFGLSQGIQ
jgi:hypothetical protein